MFSSEYHIKFCRFIKWAMITCTGFPQLDCKNSCKLREFLDEAPQDIKATSWFAQEASEYAATIASKRNSRTVIAFVLIYLLIISKYVCHALLMRLELDFNDFEKNIKSRGQQSKDHQIFEFMCLQTNCTQLSTHLDVNTTRSSSIESNLAADLKFLPIFSLCHPSLSNFYSRVADLGSLSVLIDCYLCLFLMIACVLFPLQQIRNKAGNESIMFVVAPNLTTKLLSNQLEQMYKTYLGHKAQSRALSRTTAFQREPQPNVGSGPVPDYKYLKSVTQKGSLNLRQARVSFADQKSTNSIEKLAVSRAFICDCLPAVRTSWWRAKLAWLYFSAFFWHICLIAISTSLMLAFMLCQQQDSNSILETLLLNFKTRLLDYDRFMRKEKCAIWHKDDDNQNNHVTIRLAQLNATWGLWELVETVAPILCALKIMTTLQSLIFVISCELACWLKELRQNLLVLTDLMRVRPLVLQDYCTDRRTEKRMIAVAQRCAGRRAIKTRMAMMRDLFIEHTRVTCFKVECLPLGSALGGASPNKPERTSQAQIRMVREQFAHELLLCTKVHDNHQLQRPAESRRSLLIELTEKIYLNYQLLIKLISMYSNNVTAIILLSNLVTLAAALVALFLSAVARDVSHLAYPPVVCTLSWVLFSIALVSNFHAESRKLQPLFWSLIAQLAEQSGDDAELQHLRNLLIKQTVHIDSEGGLAMSAFSFRVTYTNVIELLLWSSSVLVLTLKDHN